MVIRVKSNVSGLILTLDHGLVYNSNDVRKFWKKILLKSTNDVGNSL